LDTVMVVGAWCTAAGIAAYVIGTALVSMVLTANAVAGIDLDLDSLDDMESSSWTSTISGTYGRTRKRSRNAPPETRVRSANVAHRSRLVQQYDQEHRHDDPPPRVTAPDNLQPIRSDGTSLRSNDSPLGLPMDGSASGNDSPAVMAPPELLIRPESTDSTRAFTREASGTESPSLLPMDKEDANLI